MSNLTNEEREKLFNENIGLVHKVLERYPMYKGTEYYHDLWQEGYMGLWRATKDFNSELGIDFSVYAYRTIWGTICPYLDRFVNNRRRYKNFEHEIKISSLDIKVESDSNSSAIVDLIPCDTDFVESLENKMILDHVLSVARDLKASDNTLNTVYDIIIMQLEGYTQAQISEKLNIKQCTVSARIKRFIEYYRRKYLYLGVA